MWWKVFQWRFQNLVSFFRKKGNKKYYQTKIRVQMRQKVLQCIFQNLVNFFQGKKGLKNTTELKSESKCGEKFSNLFKKTWPFFFSETKQIYQQNSALLILFFHTQKKTNGVPYVFKSLLGIYSFIHLVQKKYMGGVRVGHCQLLLYRNEY
jgi:hypothetical protein